MTSSGLLHPAFPFGLDSRSHNHAALFYLDKDFLFRILCDFFAVSLRAGHGALILANDTHCHLLAQTLSGDGIDVPGLKSKGRYVEMNVERIFLDCMVSGTPSIGRLDQLVGGAIAEAMEATRPSASQLIVFGELAALFWERRDLESVLIAEQCWKNLANRFPFSLLCGYPIREFVEAGTEDSFLQVCAEHTTVIPPDAYPTSTTEKRILEAEACWCASAPPSRQTG